ncbi:MAG: hypothetical protein AAFR65_01850 [Pseudomonadota bacterium]
MRLTIFAMVMVLAACASREPESAQAQYFAALADERKKVERFPVLRDLPDSATPDGTTIDPATSVQLVEAAETLSPVRSEAEAATAESQLSVEEVAAELLREVELLRAKQGLPPSSIKPEDLRFPTPPPLED